MCKPTTQRPLHHDSPTQREVSYFVFLGPQLLFKPVFNRAGNKHAFEPCTSHVVVWVVQVVKICGIVKKSSRNNADYQDYSLSLTAAGQRHSAANLPQSACSYVYFGSKNFERIIHQTTELLLYLQFQFKITTANLTPSTAMKFPSKFFRK